MVKRSFHVNVCALCLLMCAVDTKQTQRKLNSLFSGDLLSWLLPLTIYKSIPQQIFQCDFENLSHFECI